MGSLTSFVALPIGSSIGQIAAAQTRARNLLPYSYDPIGEPGWGVVGAATFTRDIANQWDANFIPDVLASTNGLADYIEYNAITPVSVNFLHAVSAQFSVDPGLALASPSTRARLAVAWYNGGVFVREDFLDINPASGAIQASSGNLVNAAAEAFSAGDALGNTLRIIQLGFGVLSPGGITAARLRVYPNVNAGAGSIEAGAFQIEESNGVGRPTSFIGNSTATIAFRPLGTTPRATVNRQEPFERITANYTYQEIIDCGKHFYIDAAGITFTLPLTNNSGDWCEITINSGGTALGGPGNVTATIAATVIVGPGIPPGNTTGAITLPYDGITPAGAVGLWNTTGIRCVANVNGYWEITATSSAHGEQLLTANGNFVTPSHVSRIWVDGAGPGGGSGACTAPNSAAGGGSGGQACAGVILTTVPGTTYAVTLGTPGVAGVAGGINGGNGTATTIGALLSLAGGNGSNTAAANTQTAGQTSGGAGGGRSAPGIVAHAIGVATESNIAGAGGGGIAAPVQVGGRALGATQNAGFAGENYGGGASGAVCGPTSVTDVAGAAGGPGFVLIKW